MKNQTIELVKFRLTREWHKQLLIQGFDYDTKNLNNLVEFCDKIDESRKFSKLRVMAHTLIKNQRSTVEATNQPLWSKKIRVKIDRETLRRVSE